MMQPAETMDPTSDGHAAMFQLLALLPPPVQQRMAGMYLETLVSQVPQLAQALCAGEWAAAEPLAHKLAGSAGMMQDQPLSQAVREVERLLRDGEGGAALANWEGVLRLAALTQDALQRAYPASA